jgi:tetratricopeptide (TPR) repeat protein
MRTLSLLLCAALVLAHAADAKPKKPAVEESADASAKLKEAERLYNVGKYREAAEVIEELNRADPNPKYVYNIARAYDQAGDLEKSLEYYQQYVSSKEGTDPTLLKRAVLSIDRLKGLIAKNEEARKRQEEERMKAEEDARLAKEKADADAEAARKALEEAEAKRASELKANQRSRSRNRGIAIGAGIVGLGALGGGTYFGLQARNSKSQFDSATDVTSKRSFESQTRTQSLLADVGFAVGVAAVATAIFVWPKGGGEDGEEEDTSSDESESSEEESSLQLFVSPVGASMQVRF